MTVDTPNQVPPPDDDLASLRQKATAHHKDTWHSVRLELETITPVYGGGTTAGEPDLLLPFRPRAVKNSLRHWWWLLNRHKPEYKDDSVKLYKDMTAIWGGASDKDSDSQRAKVRVRIEGLPLNASNKIQSKEYEKSSLGYVLWMSLQAELAEKGATLVKPGYRFLIQIDIDKTLDKDLPHMNSVINAWLHLGGIGARTSRGLGKVKVGNIAATDGIDVKKFFSQNDAWFAYIKSLLIQHQTIAGQAKDTALKALEFSVDAFKTFRQARQHGETPFGKIIRNNRSYWPKADVVRFLTKRYPDYHSPHIGITRNSLPIPELLFGAPILYKFKDKGDPNPGMLSFASNNEALDRFASPLVLTVVRTGENEYLPAAFALRYWSDVAGKQVCVEPNHYIEPGKWWPDISQEANRPIAQKLLSDGTRHVAELFGGAPTDPLREAMVASAVASGNPLIAFLKFFASWDKTKK